MLQFGTPLTRGEMKQITGGSLCFDCFDNDSGGHVGSYTCDSTQDCALQGEDLCHGCTCIPN